MDTYSNVALATVSCIKHATRAALEFHAKWSLIAAGSRIPKNMYI